MRAVLGLLVVVVACSSGEERAKPSAPPASNTPPVVAEPAPVVTAVPAIPGEAVATLTPEVRAELERTWESSGTRARLKSVGMEMSSAPATRSDLGAAASFAVSRAGEPPLAADVYFFATGEALEAAAIRLTGVSFGRNGAYLVVVTAGEPGPVVNAVYGDE